MADSPFSDSQQPESPQRILASVQVSEAEYKRITTPTPEQDVKYVFFPGCNVYFQPEKILNALDIMEAIGDSHAFLPGLDYCCGDNYLFFGLQKEGGCAADPQGRPPGLNRPYHGRDRLRQGNGRPDHTPAQRQVVQAVRHGRLRHTG